MGDIHLEPAITTELIVPVIAYELVIMAKIDRMIGELDSDQQRRMTRWLADKYGAIKRGPND